MGYDTISLINRLGFGSIQQGLFTYPIDIATMCELNWALLLEYLKVILGWPPIALVIAIVFLLMFRIGIRDFLNRAIEANVFGQTVKASPPVEQQQEVKGVEENRLAQAAEAQTTQSSESDALLRLNNDPQAQIAINYVKSNPGQTVVEYRRLLFGYNCERLFNSIYGTQISLLEFLASRPTEIFTLPEIALFHTNHQALVGRTEYQLRDYINFLQVFEVMAAVSTPNNQRYKITEYGLEFLSYIKSNYPSAWNQRAY